jgi:hypothetical protein
MGLAGYNVNGFTAYGYCVNNTVLSPALQFFTAHGVGSVSVQCAPGQSLLACSYSPDNVYSNAG